MCLPTDERIMYGVILGLLEDKSYMVEGEAGRCRFLPCGPKDDSTLQRRAANCIGSGISERHLKRAASIGGELICLSPSGAGHPVFPVVSRTRAIRRHPKSCFSALDVPSITIDDWRRVLSSQLELRNERVYIFTQVLAYLCSTFRSYFWNYKLG